VEGIRITMTISGYVISKVENFEKFGSFVQKYEGFGMDIKHWI
jgi:hypothetical protein